MTEADKGIVRYGNFRNPFGLVVRMLRSGHRAAYAALFREGMKLAVLPLDLALSLFERRNKSGSQAHPLLLMVGPPRSGTTLIYQVLASCLDVSYFSNLVAMFPRSPVTAAKLFRPFMRRTTGDFTSYFGQTSRFSGPHDGFMIWNRWLGSNRYEPNCDIGTQEKAEMAGFFSAWTSAFAKPLLNKNNRNTVCIDALAGSLPSAWFIVVRRDLQATARSLIRAREQVQGNKRFGWGLLSCEKHANDDLGYVDDVCQQVVEIDRQISEQLRNVDPSRVINISYEEFCDAPSALIDQLADKVPGVEVCQKGRDECPQSFTRSASRPLSQREEDRIASCIASYVSREAISGSCYNAPTDHGARMPDHDQES